MMKRFGLLLLVLIAAAVIVFLVLRRKGMPAASSVASLLPADTAVLIHIPDVEKNRDDWHGTDLYQLYREPAVQDFLQKPRTHLPKSSALGDAWRDSASLRIRDAFLAANNLDALRVTGGFEFRCGEKEARSVIERWKGRWTVKGAQRNSSAYQNHAIDILTSPKLTMASVVVGHRFFVATSVDDLKVLLDRLDGREKEHPLSSDGSFRAAMKQMPADYAGLLYIQPKPLAQKLVTLRAQNGRALSAGQETLIEEMQSIAHAIVFDGGKLRDIDFIGMPRLVDTKLTRETLGAASTDTFFYLALIMNLRQQFASGMTAQNSPLTSAGVTLEDWEAAFGDEMSLLAEWPATARMPTAVATLAVRDSARAKTVARALASTAGWQSSTRDSAEYFTAPATGLAIMRLISAVSDKRLAIGLDAASVQRAISPPANASTLASAAGFRDASRLVPEPQQMFAWLDLPTLYGRLDATLRPLLQISAAFVPDASERFDVNKLPPAETVRKHLSPVVASQSYVDGGYRSESVGSITLGQAVVLGVGGYIGSQFFQKHADIPAMWRIGPAPNATPTSTP
jgi:hypothetical protein